MRLRSLQHLRAEWSAGDPLTIGLVAERSSGVAAADDSWVAVALVSLGVVALSRALVQHPVHERSSHVRSGDS
jgi:hypothetical protein